MYLNPDQEPNASLFFWEKLICSALEMSGTAVISVLAIRQRSLFIKPSSCIGAGYINWWNAYYWSTIITAKRLKVHLITVRPREKSMLLPSLGADFSPCSQPPTQMCKPFSEKQGFPSKHMLEVSRITQGAASPSVWYLGHILGDSHAGAAVPVLGRSCQSLREVKGCVHRWPLYYILSIRG